MTSQLARKPYPSDLTDAQWELLAPFIPEPGPESPREPVTRREIVNGILYVLRTGCSWRQMPHDLPNGKTVYHYFRRWKLDGTWEKAMTHLRRAVRTQMGRDPEREPRPSSIANPSKPVLCEASSVATTPGKKIWGRKRQVLVDTQGFLLAVRVHAANIVDRVGARLLLRSLVGRFARLSHLFADRAYTGPLLDWIKTALGWDTEIVPTSENDSHQQWVLIAGV